MTIEEAHEECKKRYPIGCTYINADPRATGEDKEQTILLLDDITYSIRQYNTGALQIWAHSGGGCLYYLERGKEHWAKTDKVFKKPKPKKDDLKALVKLLKEII